MSPTTDQVLDLINQVGLEIDPTFAVVVLRRLPGKVDVFDDWLCILWRDGARWEIRAWACTADPGLYWLHNPGKVEGTAILVPGQHLMTLGEHKGQYPCLVQAEALAVWRDGDRDNALRYGGRIYRDSIGIQIHHAGAFSTIVDRWSAGCIVVAALTDWTKFWKFIQSANRSTFPVTLLEYRT